MTLSISPLLSRCWYLSFLTCPLVSRLRFPAVCQSPDQNLPAQTSLLVSPHYAAIMNLEIIWFGFEQ